MASQNKKQKKAQNTDDDASGSSKSSTLTLELHSNVAEELDPLLLVSFPGGKVNEALKINHERVSGSSWKSQLTSETRELDYSATNYGRNNQNQNGAQWLVGVADMSTDTITLHPVSHTYAFRATLKNSKSTGNNEGNESTARERRALLFEDFGASKKKRALAASAANLVSSEQAIGADALTSWMDSTAVDNTNDDNVDETDAALVEGRRVLLPRFDLNAKATADCFDVKGMVGPSERAALGRQLDSLKTGKDWLDSEALNDWPAYVITRLGGETDKDRLVDLLLLRHLITLLVRPSKHFRGPLKDDAKALGIPTEVMKSLLDKFAVAAEDAKREGSVTWRITKNLQDKLILHLLVLALAVSSFKVSTSELCTDLKMSASEVANFFRLTACRISVDKSSAGHTAVLTAPLVFPGRRRKRG